MIIYIVTFSLSILLIKMALDLKKKSRILYFIIVMLALIIPGILAAGRDISIGSDTKGYILGSYNIAKKYPIFMDYFKSMPAEYAMQDFMYQLVNFLCYYLFYDFKVFLFVYEMLIILPVYKSITLFTENKKNIVLSMLIFYLFWYNVTLNMARQSLALAFSMLSLGYLNKNKKVRAFITAIIAVGFHKTALLGILVDIIFILYNSKCFSYKQKLGYSVIIYTLSIVAVLGYQEFIEFLIATNIYSHGQIYLDQINYDFSYLDNAIYIFVLIIVFLKKKHLENNKINYDFFIFLAIESLIILQFGTFVPYAERISFYLFYPLLINIMPILDLKDGIYNNKRDFAQMLSIVGVFSCYWILNFVVLGTHNTIPYIMQK